MRMLLLTSLVLISLLPIALALYIRRTLSPIRRLNRLAGQVTADTLDQPLNLEAALTATKKPGGTGLVDVSQVRTTFLQKCFTGSRFIMAARAMAWVNARLI